MLQSSRRVNGGTSVGMRIAAGKDHAHSASMPPAPCRAQQKAFGQDIIVQEKASVPAARPPPPPPGARMS
jgi:hypothetical protein